MTHASQSARLSPNTTFWVQISKHFPPAILSFPSPCIQTPHYSNQQAHRQRTATTCIFPRPSSLLPVMRTTIPCPLSWDLNSPHSVTGFVPARGAYEAFGCPAMSSGFAAKQVSALTTKTGAVSLDKHLSYHLHNRTRVLVKLL